MNDVPGSPSEGTADLLRLLGLPAGATDAEIRRSFRSAVKRAHPDAGGDAAQATQLLSAYNAYRASRFEDGHAEPDANADPWDEEWPDVPSDGSGIHEPSRRPPPPSSRLGGDMPRPWFMAPPAGPTPQEGFWSKRPR